MGKRKKLSRNQRAQWKVKVKKEQQKRTEDALQRVRDLKPSKQPTLRKQQMPTHRETCKSCNGTAKQRKTIIEGQEGWECFNCDSCGMFLVYEDGTKTPDYGWMPGFGTCVAAEKDIPILD